jgi:hypothetical protein
VFSAAALALVSAETIFSGFAKILIGDFKTVVMPALILKFSVVRANAMNMHLAALDFVHTPDAGVLFSGPGSGAGE